ncbi:hypothetical protein CSA80_02360 [Candidatus Saccharibacteria bacterium]|nr:MAG: hypothetical protein CR973_00450 [Candidatus Saccharibacteria bacterium]PID99581.1 MAG: hypothetical protein CSA80_02360 [Candidatus Saccharibacteria bacterium]
MDKAVSILGRQPALGLAELESLYGAEVVSVVAPGVTGLALDAPEVNFARLGGSTRLATVLGEVSSTDFKHVEKSLISFVKSTAFALPDEGKFHLGLSAYGFTITPAKLNALGLTLKKVIRKRHNGSVRLVPNNAAELSTAQVYHNHLANDQGAELLLIKTTGEKTIIARTVAVQDIDSYTLRDRGRPQRDARVGMLPPKLAQIIVNMATASHRPLSEITVLDPFCGTGVLLQEALLMGCRAYGTDLEPRMIAYSTANLDWLSKTYGLQPERYKLSQGDATSHEWNLADDQTEASGRTHTANRRQPAYTVACETYLGRPFTEAPARAVLEQTVSEVNTIVKKFLANIHPQLAPGTRLCLAVPAWYTGANWSEATSQKQSADRRLPPVTAFRRLPLLEQLGSLGFKRINFQHAPQEQLIYYREGQLVGRELVTLTRE